MLEEIGCEVAASVARLPRAYQALEATPLDFALLDVNVASEPSFDLARTLAASGVPFIFSTGYGNSGLPPDLEDRPLLAKPFTLSDLRASVAAVLGKPA